MLFIFKHCLCIGAEKHSFNRAFCGRHKFCPAGIGWLFCYKCCPFQLDFSGYLFPILVIGSSKKTCRVSGVGNKCRCPSQGA